MAPKMAGLIDLIEYFSNPISQRQKQYEAVRAVVLETQPPEIVSKTFGYKTSTIYSLIRDAKAGKIKLFPIVKKGPRQRRTSPEVQKRIIVLRKQGLRNLSTTFGHSLKKITEDCFSPPKYSPVG